MGVTTTKTNKPFNPRGNDQSPKGYNRASLFSGKALDFDGVNDYVDCGSIEVQSFSLITNVYLDLLSNTDTLAGNWDSSNGFMLYKNASNNMFVYINSAKVQTDISQYVGNWTQFVATYDGTTAKLYANGVLINSEAYAATITYSSGSTFKVGAYGNTPGGLLNGDVAGTKLFNTTLTAAQVADLYNNPEKVVPTGVDNTALKLWLPMMEGAGTTAYDGSGNGNHGTISGATYVNGIGAPVAQSAVIDWNKGTNVQINSEDFTQSNWLKEDLSITANATTAPDGSNTATKIVANTTNIDHTIYDPIPIADYVHSVFAKAEEYDYIFLGKNNNSSTDGVFFDLVNGTINQNTSTLSATIEEVSGAEGWYRCSVIGNMRYNIICLSENGTSLIFAGDNSSGVSIWGASIISGTTAGPYVRTGATAQTSDVLLPQGLTTGRDITGVNLFENVRKQGALNLDGNSWAEVHDNASVDLTTGATLECWYKWGTQLNAGLLGRWDYPNNQRSLLILHGALDNARLLFSFDGTNAAAVEGTSTPADGTWVHIAGTYDGTTFRLYVNATQEATASSTGVLFNSPDSVEIGRHGYGALDEINGSIAQPRIYNRALTAEEVQRNYNAGKNTYTN